MGYIYTQKHNRFNAPKITFSRNVTKISSKNSLRNVSKNVSKIFLSMLCFGEKRHRIGNTEGYVYIWNCSLIVQKAYSSSTQLTRLKIQINTQITNHQKSHHQISHSKKYHKIIRYCSSTNSPIHPTSRSIKTISKIPYIKPQNLYPYHTFRQTTTHSTLTFMLKT